MAERLHLRSSFRLPASCYFSLTEEKNKKTKITNPSGKPFIHGNNPQDSYLYCLQWANFKFVKAQEFIYFNFYLFFISWGGFRRTKGQQFVLFFYLFFVKPSEMDYSFLLVGFRFSHTHSSYKKLHMIWGVSYV